MNDEQEKTAPVALEVQNVVHEIKSTIETGDE